LGSQTASGRGCIESKEVMENSLLRVGGQQGYGGEEKWAYEEPSI